jgi:hypothetical protein
MVDEAFYRPESTGYPLGASRRARRNAITAAAGLGLALIAGACSPIHDVPIANPVPAATPAVDRSSIVVGVHYAPGFRTHVAREICPPPIYRVAQTFNYALGAKSTALFNHALGAMFSGVVPVDDWPPPPGRADVDAVIRLQILSTELPAGQLCHDRSNATVRFKATLHAPSGAEIASWSFSGEGVWNPAAIMRLLTLKSPLAFAGEATRDALRDAAARFVTGSRDAPGIRGWIAAHARHAGAGPADPPADGGAASATGIVLLAQDPHIPDCAGEAVADAAGDKKFVPWQTFRDSLYPWLEGRFTLGEPARLHAALQTASVRRRIGKLGVRYLVEVSGTTALGPAEGAIGGGAGAIGGVLTQNRRTRLVAGIYDLRKGQVTSKLRASSTGTGVMVWLGVPFPFIPATESAACGELAGKLAKALRGGGPDG